MDDAMDDAMYDVVIVGGGPAGLSAALVLGRARRRVALVDAGEPRNARAHEAHGFLTRDGITPGELLALGRAEVAGYGVELIDDRVVDASPGFEVRLGSGRTLAARRLLVTTGLRDVLPEIPGVAELWGNDVHFCPYCHGYEARDQPIAVLADEPIGEHKARLLRQWSDDVEVFTPAEVVRLVVEDGRLAGVELADRVVRRTAAFVHPEFVPTDGLLTGLGCETNEQGWVAVDAAGRTSVPGVWAAGNVVDPMMQLITAAGQGSAVAIALNNDFVFEVQPAR